MTPTTSFKTWLATQTDRSAEIGEFARSILADPSFPDCPTPAREAFDKSAEHLMLKLGTCRIYVSASKERRLSS
jgi:uncharacterized protein YozE (UPF0346 family)